LLTLDVMTMSSPAADREGRERRPDAAFTAEGLLRQHAAHYPETLALADPGGALLQQQPRWGDGKFKRLA
jgi:hypothetical protein